MNPLTPTFIVVKAGPLDEVIGRNGNVPLQRGMSFDRLQRVRMTLVAERYHSEDVGPPLQIDLTLEEIHAYQKTLEELSSGMTASLKFSGDDLKKIIEAFDGLPKGDSLVIEKGCYPG